MKKERAMNELYQVTQFDIALAVTFLVIAGLLLIAHVVFMVSVFWTFVFRLPRWARERSDDAIQAVNDGRQHAAALAELMERQCAQLAGVNAKLAKLLEKEISL